MQRSIENKSILVATYEGEHNHDLYSSGRGNNSSTTRHYFSSSSPDNDHDDDYRKIFSEGSPLMLSSGTFLPADHPQNMDTSTTTSSTSTRASPISQPRDSITLDLTLSCINQNNSNNVNNNINRSDHHCNTLRKVPKDIEEYVASLTKDRNFTIALAAAVARSFADRDHLHQSTP